jgi:hypothetical protein
MSTLDTHLAANPLGQPTPDPAASPDPDERLPVVAAEVEAEPDQLPRAGSACRYCGTRAAADAMRVGGTFRIPADVPAPADATGVRRVNLGMDALQFEAAQKAREAGDMRALGRAKAGRVCQEVTVPSWRVCSACEALDRDPDPLALTMTALGRPAPFPRTPTTLYVVERHPVQPYHAAGGQPTDRGGREPWAHADDARSAAAELLAELERAGGVPAPVGPGCGICGRTHSPYGWRSATWRPPGTASATPAAVALCDGWRVTPGDRSRHPRAEPVRSRVGCGLLVELPAQAGPLVERVYEAARRDGAESPHPRSVHSSDKDRFMAWAHPEFRRAAGPRPPWWHLADVPLPPPSAVEAMARRLAELERRLSEVPA